MIPEPKTWNGESEPHFITDISDAELEYVWEMFIDYKVLWRLQHYNAQPTQGVLDSFWLRARRDAHATFRTDG